MFCYSSKLFLHTFSNQPLLKKLSSRLLKRNLKYSACSKCNRVEFVQETNHTVSKANIYTKRSHTCGELRISDEEKHVTLCGWLQYQRLNLFAILRDGYGQSQIIIPQDRNDLKSLLDEATLESVLQIDGVVKKRPEDQINKDMSTGDIEVIASSIRILNKSEKTLPFHIRNYKKAKEDLRMKYRYLDFRFPEMQYNLRFRSNFLMRAREFLIQHRDFIEVETPTLFKRTPGGAKEFVVPTHEKDQYYCLVQSPQQLKQLLMVGSIDRYFQIARCYRDESTKPNRQPEFTQLDIELSFTTREAVMRLIEELICFCLNVPHYQFSRMTYDEAMNIYGTDKPDLRYDCKIKNLDSYLTNKDGVNIASKLIILSNTEEKLTKKLKTQYQKLAKENYNVTLSFLKIDEHWKDKLLKIFPDINIDAFIKNIDVHIGDVLVLSTGVLNDTLLLLGYIRSDYHNHTMDSPISPVNIEDKGNFNILWVVDFPLFLPSEDGSVESAHHPFTQPHPDDIDLLQNDPLKVRGLHYDLVLNGDEIGGGSIRIHDSSLQELIFKLLNIEPNSLQHMLEAFKYGCPPHGGIALGVDRLMAILCGAQSIRDVIAFPKGYGGKDLLSGAPCNISKEEKKYYHLT